MKDANTTRSVKYICIVSSAVVSMILWPLNVVMLNAVAFIGWSTLQFVSLLSCCKVPAKPSAPATKDRSEASVGPVCRQNFVSVHLPIHNEPPDVVRATLNALALLDYAAAEFIVIDNNTEDSTLWLPVKRHCERLGNRFRFLHRMDVTGAKSGALEIARSIMDERTTHVAIVDADYQVTPDFLNLAMTALERTGTDYAQFPQSYREITEEQQSVESELGDYFDRHAVAADYHGDMLLTGTLSVIDADALHEVGGWPMQTVTEDAELAMAFRRSGLRGTYVPRVAGRGLLPPDLHELKSQRHRWIVGNVQTLIRTLCGSVMEKRKYVSTAHWAQLSAWCSFVTLPLVMLLAGVFLSFAGVSDPELWHSVSLVASATIAGQLLMTIGLSRGSSGFLFVRWTLALSSGWATLSALSMQPIRFRCTKRHAMAGVRVCTTQLLAPLLFMTAAALALALAWYTAAAALLLFAGTCATSGLLDRILRAPSTTESITQNHGISTSHGK